MMVAVPTFKAVIFPLEPTLATEASLLTKLTLLLLASDGEITALTVALSPIYKIFSSALRATPVTLSKTLITQEAFLAPSTVTAVTVAEPMDFAIISPETETETTLGSELAQFTVLLDASDGRTDATSFVSVPLLMTRLVLFSVTEVTC